MLKGVSMHCFKFSFGVTKLMFITGTWILVASFLFMRNDMLLVDRMAVKYQESTLTSVI